MLTLYIVSKHTRMDIVMIGTLEDQGAAPLFIVYIWWVLFQFWISSTFSVLDYIPNSTCYLKRLWYYYEIDFLQQIIITTFLVCCQSPKRRLQTMVWGQGGLGVGGWGGLWFQQISLLFFNFWNELFGCKVYLISLEKHYILLYNKNWG